MEVGLRPGDFVLHGDPSPSAKREAEAPIFGPCLLRSNGWMDQVAIWYRGRPRPQQHCVTWGPSFAHRGHNPPQFSANVYCGQTAAWIKMPFGTQVRLGPADIVSDKNRCAPVWQQVVVLSYALVC